MNYKIMYLVYENEKKNYKKKKSKNEIEKQQFLTLFVFLF